MSGLYSVFDLCYLAKVSRSGYCKWLKRSSLLTPKDIEDKMIKEYILEIHNKYRGTYGRKRICIYLNKASKFPINNKRVYRLMKELGIQSVIRKKVYKHKFKPAKVASSILNRNFKANKPLEKLSMDITYIPINRHSRSFLYLSAVKDLYNDEIIAYKMSLRNDTKLVAETIQQLYKLDLAKNCILHTDQGFQYTRKQYSKELKKNNIIQSMSRRGNCWDNIPIEIFLRHLKSELIYLIRLNNVNELVEQIDNYIYFYNNERIQLKNSMSPIEYRNHAV